MTRADMDSGHRGLPPGDGTRGAGRASTWSSCTSPTATCSRASSRRSRTTARDEYGGSLENRLRYPLEVFAAVRGAFPAGRPMSVRISATDWVGTTASRATTRSRSATPSPRPARTSSTSPPARPRHGARPIYGRMFQTPLADQVRNEARVATMAVGNITEPDHVNSIIMAGRADLCCLAGRTSAIRTGRCARPPSSATTASAGPIRTLPAASSCAGSRAAPPRWPCGSDGPARRAARPRHGGGLRHRQRDRRRARGGGRPAHARRAATPAGSNGAQRRSAASPRPSAT